MMNPNTIEIERVFNGTTVQAEARLNPEYGLWHCTCTIPSNGQKWVRNGVSDPWKELVEMIGDAIDEAQAQKLAHG